MSTLYFDAGPPASGQKVLLATTAYDSPDASYTFSIQSSRQALKDAGIQTAYLLLSGNCHVDDARNAVVRDFLASDCTDLVFIDADVSWRAGDLVTLCGYGRDIVGGVYPYRRPNQRGMPVRLMQGCPKLDKDGLLPVDGLPTGFLRIKRHVLESLAGCSELYTPKDESGPTSLLFERTMIESDRWSGDLSFCRKWRDLGGELFAAPEIRLGHVAKQVVYGSLGAELRRQRGETLAFVADKIRQRRHTVYHLKEAFEFVGNPFAAQEDVLGLAVGYAARANGPIIEMGSGLSTVLMAAATDQTVYCIEHSLHYAQLLEAMARSAGVSNIGVCHAPIKDGWYDMDCFDGLPDRFALGVVDGPPRSLGSRMGFMPAFGGKCDKIIFDDADDVSYVDGILDWAQEAGRDVIHRIERALVLSEPYESVRKEEKVA